MSSRAITFLLFVICLPSFCQIDSTKSTQSDKGIFRRVGNDGKLAVKTIIGTYARPLHWKKKEWLIFGGTLAVSTVSTLLDEPLYKYTVDHQTDFFDDVASVGDFLGQPENNYPFMIALWGTGVIANNDWMRDTGIMLFASVTTSGLIQTACKELVGRARPATGVGPYAFKPFGGIPYHSFPSGHTMLSVATSWVLARQVPWLPAKIIFFSLPAVVGASRIYDGAHWFSDILLGSALGIACAESVVKIYPQLKGEKNRLSFFPTPSGFILSYKM